MPTARGGSGSVDACQPSPRDEGQERMAGGSCTRPGSDTIGALVAARRLTLRSPRSAGVFTVTGLIDSVVYHGGNSLKRKMEIGKGI
eukprot:5721695-Prymnesium_polylepis.1